MALVLTVGYSNKYNPQSFADRSAAVAMTSKRGRDVLKWRMSAWVSAAPPAPLCCSLERNLENW